jgi:glycerol transport system ATP-binding protein
MSVRLDGIRRIVRDEVWIDTVTLDLAPSQLYVLLGPTLAGKTSLMRLIAGLDRPSSGRILVEGVDVTGLSVRKRSVAMVYQQFINYPTLTAFDNIASPLRLQGMAKAEIDRQVSETARMLHIDHLLARLPAELSGGQQQRLAIARALVKKAQLLLLDEPLVNLDYKLREELRAELRDLFARQQTTVVYATTEPLEALIMGGEVIVMDEGRVLQSGPTIQVYHRPGSLRVAGIYSDPPMNTLEVTVADRYARGRSGLSLPLSHHLAELNAGAHTLGVRANHLSIRYHRDGDVAIDATVELSEISGSETFIHVRNGDLRWVVQEEGVHVHALGEAVKVHLDPARLYAFDRAGALEVAPARPSGPA